MSLREQLILKDGKARPPALLRKVCVHGGTSELEGRFRGDMAFDLDWVLGRQVETYTCIQCGYALDAPTIMRLYQRYMARGEAVVVGRNIKHG